MSTYDVKIHPLSKRKPRTTIDKLGKVKKGKSKPWRVRWVVAGQRPERYFASQTLADNFRNELLNAVKAGCPFDEITGLPEPMIKERNRTTWYAHARAYMEMKWPDLAPNSRTSTVEGLVTVTVVLVTDRRGAPDSGVLREALSTWAFRPPAWNEPPSPSHVSALTWLEKHSLPVVRLKEPDAVRLGLNACGRRLDGSTAAPTTKQRKRATFYNAIEHAVERNLIDYNPLDKVKTKATKPVPVDRRVVANTGQVERILAACEDVTRNGGRYVAHFGNQYYCAMRPSESANLRLSDCELPAWCLDCGADVTHVFEPGDDCAHERERVGWGRIILVETEPYAGSAWTDDGNSYDKRGLKHREKKTTRPVPCPPEQVRNLRTHVKRYGLTPDGRFFCGERGGPLAYSTCDRTWKLARKAALTPEQVASPLVGTQYDLRHGCLSLQLNGGVPATEVARRAGQSVAVLLAVYANCIDGEEEMVNARISAALAASRRRGAIGGRKALTYTVIHAKRQVRRRI